MPSTPKYRRILLKLSGEGLMGDRQYGIDPDTIERICDEVKGVHDQGVQICLVMGAGNIFRGVSSTAKGVERTSADYMGMLATVINALAMQSTLENLGVPTRVQSAIPMATVRHLEKGRIVIFAAGTGNPFFSTDTAAAVRAVEMNCDALFKGTQVDGVYDSDPKENKKAKRFDKLTYQEVLSQDLRVMDASAIALARENEVPILVFSIHNPGGFAEVVFGEGTYTIIN